MLLCLLHLIIIHNILIIKKTTTTKITTTTITNNNKQPAQLNHPKRLHQNLDNFLQPIPQKPLLLFKQQACGRQLKHLI